MTTFTPWQSLLGGGLIGLAAVLLMATLGRTAGMTGILTGLSPPVAPDWRWRAAFIGGAILAPLCLVLSGTEIAFAVPVSTTALVVGGLLVGVGVHLGNGCPSGHGICGLARASPRSLAAVLTFMATAFVTVFVIRHGGLTL